MSTIHKEGDLYKVINLFGNTFEVRYGYYDEEDRTSKFSEAIPIYPDFLKSPIFTPEGYPFVTQMQDICRYYEGEENSEECFICKHYRQGEDLLGVCIYDGNKKSL